MLPFSVVLLQQIHCYAIGLLRYYGNATNSFSPNSNCHVTMETPSRPNMSQHELLEEFSAQLREERQRFFFQQDGTTCHTSTWLDVRSCVLMQKATTFNIFYDGKSFQHLASVLISVFTLCCGPGLLFRGPPCISPLAISLHCREKFW
jgi:hypothetical protein